MKLLHFALLIEIRIDKAKICVKVNLDFMPFWLLCVFFAPFYYGSLLLGILNIPGNYKQKCTFKFSRVYGIFCYVDIQNYYCVDRRYIDFFDVIFLDCDVTTSQAQRPNTSLPTPFYQLTLPNFPKVNYLHDLTVTG